jgi:hypothetical protein
MIHAYGALGLEQDFPLEDGIWIDDVAEVEASMRVASSV